MNRSEIMRRVKSTGNKSTEIKFRTALSRAGVRGWSIQPEIQGHPDVAFLRDKVAVFLDGCFWHGCDDHFKAPRTRTRTWVKKIQANKTRDARNVAALLAEGWKVFRIWEHDLADDENVKGLALRVARAADTKDIPELVLKAARAPIPGLEQFLCIPCAKVTGHFVKDLSGFGIYKETTCEGCGTVTRRVNGRTLERRNQNGD